jgi:hypothetical protein
MINFVGFTSLILQPLLQKGARRFLQRRGVEKSAEWRVDPLFGLFWTTADASDPTIYLFHLIVAGWVGIAGILQALINFSTEISFEMKRACLFTFFVCDLFWIGLMASFRDQFKWTHIWGSAVTIAWRLPFVLFPSLMLKH